jgi:hypothetical protein
MMLQIIGYTIAVAAVLGMVGLCLARVARLNALPGRFGWIAAMLLSVLLLAGAGAGAALALEAPALPARATAMAPMTASPAAQTEPQAGASAPESFMVRLLSPVAEPFVQQFAFRAMQPRPATDVDAATRARLERHYTILAEKLRAVPGLVLVTEATPGVPGVPYEIAIRLGADWQGVQIEGTSARFPPGHRVLWMSEPTNIANIPRLTALWDSVPADNLDRDMDNLIQRMRLEMFPPDRVFLDQKMSEFLDPQLDTMARRQALYQLLTADGRRDSLGTRVVPRTYRPDPDLLGAATDVALTASDPALRLQVWNTLTTARIPRIDPVVLVAPAERALARERDLRVQLMMVDILGMSPANSRARAALQSLASSDADSGRAELVRMAARRVVDGGAGWNDYFVARMKDPQVSDTELIELINYVYSISGAIGSLRLGDAASQTQMDEAALRSLASLMKKQGSTDVAVAAVGLLRSAGGSVAREEFVDYLRAGTGSPLADNKVRRAVLSGLAYELRSHPEMRPLFQEVSGKDTDPVLREAAQQALDQTR